MNGCNMTVHRDYANKACPGMSYAVKGQTGKGVFTITEVQDGWGKLKCGAGWISLDYASKV